MEKFIPYEKLSKKEKRKIDQARRQTWGELNPVTRKPENSKAYNRKRTQDWKENFQTCVRLICFTQLKPTHFRRHGASCVVWVSEDLLGE